MGFWDFLRKARFTSGAELPPDVFLHVSERRPDGAVGRVIRVGAEGNVIDTAAGSVSMSAEEFSVIKDLAVRATSARGGAGRALWSARLMSSRGEVLKQSDCPEPLLNETPPAAWGLFAELFDRIKPDSSRRRAEEVERAQAIRPDTLARALDAGESMSVVYQQGSPYDGYVRLELGSDGAALVRRTPRGFPPPPGSKTTLEGRLPPDTLPLALAPMRDPRNWAAPRSGPPGSSSCGLEIRLRADGKAARRWLTTTQHHPTIEMLRAAIARLEARAIEPAPPARIDGACPFCGGSAWRTLVDVPGGTLARCACGARLARGDSPAELAKVATPEVTRSVTPLPIAELLRELQEGDFHVKAVEVSETGGASRLLFRPWTDRDHAAQAGPCPWCGSSKIHQVRSSYTALIVHCVCGAAAALFKDYLLESAAACFDLPADTDEAGFQKAGVLLTPSTPTPDGRRRRLWCARPAIQPLQVELIRFLRAIETGDVALSCDRQPKHEVTPLYRASNGWSLVVFIDANDWDYIDSITTADGRRFGFDDLAKLPWICHYYPSAEVQWTRYGLPHDGVPEGARWPGAP